MINERNFCIEEIILIELVSITILFGDDIIDMCHEVLVSVLYSYMCMGMDMDICRNALPNVCTGSQVVIIHNLEYSERPELR